jgi:hypothetical protein
MLLPSPKWLLISSWHSFQSIFQLQSFTKQNHLDLKVTEMMAEDGAVFPVLSLNVLDTVETVEDSELTPSPVGLKHATKQRHTETSSSSKGSSGSLSSSSSDNSNSDESASSKDSDYKHCKKRKSSPEQRQRLLCGQRHKQREGTLHQTPSPGLMLMFMCALTQIAQPVKNWSYQKTW